MTEAPSYAPTTDTYAPTYGSCPSLIFSFDAAKCPADATGLPLCNEAGLKAGAPCVTGAEIFPDQPGGPGPTNCLAEFGQDERRQLLTASKPATRSFHNSGSAATEAQRRLQA